MLHNFHIRNNLFQDEDLIIPPEDPDNEGAIDGDQSGIQLRQVVIERLIL